MDNLYVSAGIVACIFLLAKFIEIRFISKPSEDETPDPKPMKNALRDAAIVFVCYILEREKANKKKSLFSHHDYISVLKYRISIFLYI